MAEVSPVIEMKVYFTDGQDTHTHTHTHTQHLIYATNVY